jgi:hypothetical protein
VGELFGLGTAEACIQKCLSTSTIIRKMTLHIRALHQCDPGAIGGVRAPTALTNDCLDRPKNVGHETFFSS